MDINGCKDKKIFLTGASGFIGRVLLRRLLKRGFRVRVLLNKNDIKIDNPRLEKVWTDINSLSLDKHLQGIDTVVHLAVYMGNMKDKNGKKFYKVNYAGTKNLFNLARKRKIRFIYCSSIVVKGKGKDWYTKSKLRATNFIKRSKYLNWVIVYPTTVINVKRAIEGRTPGFLMARIGSSKRIMNIVDVKNVAKALLKIIEQPKTKGEYVLGGINIGVADYLKKMARLKGKLYLPVRIPRCLVKNLVFLFWGKNNLYNILSSEAVSQRVFSKRAIEKLSYEPKRGLKVLL